MSSTSYFSLAQTYHFGEFLHSIYYLDGVVQKCGISDPLAMEIGGIYSALAMPAQLLKCSFNFMIEKLKTKLNIWRNLNSTFETYFCMIYSVF